MDKCQIVSENRLVFIDEFFSLSEHLARKKQYTVEMILFIHLQRMSIGN